MKTTLLPAESPEAIPTALRLLQHGQLIAFPTDTVYGLAALIHDQVAIDRLYEAKERSPVKAIAVLIGDLSQIDQVAAGLPVPARRLAEHFWPGALTLVVPRRADLPANLSPDLTIGIRMPDHAFARDLLRAAGPLATTSANLSGGPNPKDAQEVLVQLEGRVELVLDGGPASGGIPSTVVGCTGPDLTIFREGAIPADQIRKQWSA
jgi:L-threonylcarbamoyladenylate synthase